MGLVPSLIILNRSDDVLMLMFSYQMVLLVIDIMQHKTKNLQNLCIA